jgi:hypothetical protein
MTLRDAGVTQDDDTGLMQGDDTGLTPSGSAVGRWRTKWIRDHGGLLLIAAAHGDEDRGDALVDFGASPRREVP